MALVKLNNRGVRSATTFGSITSLGSMVFIKKQTASSSATISFVDGTSDVVLDNTYKEYLFTFKNIHPSAQAAFSFNGSIDSGSNYNVAKTTTAFNAAHKEDDSGTNLGYESTYDLAQGTGFQILDQENLATDNDNGLAGTLHLFNPSSTTFVKHFISRCPHNASSGIWCNDTHVAGYFNTTSAIDAVQFKMASGNIDAGDICLYGIN
jgi:hypothetical protein